MEFEGSKRFPLIFLVFFGLLKSYDCANSKRTRIEIPEIEELELKKVVANENYVAVLYHDHSKVRK